MKSAIIRWLSTALVLCITLVFAIRQFQFVDRYALNILFWDQWDLYSPIFNHRSVWHLFTFQHGPHRQGVGFLITPMLARLSGCNTRWDAFAICYTMVAACILGLILSVRCGVKQPIALLAVPLIYLTVRQYESFTGPSNLSHGAMPILMFTALCVAWFIRHDFVRTAIVSLLTFCLIFTGFGLFVGLLIPLVFLTEAIQAWQQKQRAHASLAAGAILACAISWALFSIGYIFDPANADFHFPYEKPWEYFEFAAVMLANFFGGAINNPLAIPLGVLLFAGLTAMSLYHLQRFIRNGALQQRTSVVIFLLASFALIFCLNTAIGRISSDWQTDALASRYVTLMIPAAMAIFLQLATLDCNVRSTAWALVYALLILPGAWHLTAYDWDIVHVVHDRRIAWRNAFLATHNELQANAISNFSVYPRPGAIKNRLKFIEIYHLNFFKNVPPTPARMTTP